MAPHGNRRAPLRTLVATGVVELRPDPARPRGWTLLVNGVPQPYVDLADPAAGVATDGFARAAAKALKPGGLLAMNLTDVPPLAHTRRQVATAYVAFGKCEVVLFGEIPVVRGRRAGNVILLARNVPMINAGKHECVLSGIDLGNFTGGARPLRDEPD